MLFREATPSDVDAIAALHADSWCRNYRGAYPDAFLDNDVVADRQAVWSARFAAPHDDSSTILAEDDGELVGFAHTKFDEDERWGSLLDNLHVVHHRKGTGVGKLVMCEVGRVLIEQRPRSALYLWVLEQNVAAQGFYAARGGATVERAMSTAPGGGEVAALRVAWSDPATLLI